MPNKIKKSYLFTGWRVCLITLALATCCALTGCNLKKENTLTLKEKIDSIVNPRIEVGAAIGIIYNNQKYTYFYGSKIAGGDTPPDAGSIFEIGSITKTFTGTILADVHLKGLVDIDQPAGDFLPADKVTMPTNYGEEITFHHLTTHTSGLPRMPDNIDEHVEFPDNPYATYTCEHMYEFLNGCELHGFKTHLYSNLGVGLLGHVLGLAQGMPYETLLTRTVFDALEMNDSSLFLTESQKNNLAPGHNLSHTVVSNWTAGDCFQGAGSIKSSLNDMMKYLEANLGMKETPLQEAMELAREPRSNAYLGRIGMGWFIDELDDGQEIIDHNGGTSGYYAFIGFNPALRTGVVVLCNCKATTMQDRIGTEILKMLKLHE